MSAASVNSDTEAADIIDHHTLSIGEIVYLLPTDWYFKWRKAKNLPGPGYSPNVVAGRVMPIDCSCLSSTTHPLILRLDELVEKQDYWIVPEIAYEYLKRVHKLKEGSPEFPRRVISIGAEVKVELSACLSFLSCHGVDKSEVVGMYSRYWTPSQILDDIVSNAPEAWGKLSRDSTRLWKKRLAPQTDAADGTGGAAGVGATSSEAASNEGLDSEPSPPLTTAEPERVLMCDSGTLGEYVMNSLMCAMEVEVQNEDGSWPCGDLTQAAQSRQAALQIIQAAAASSSASSAPVEQAQAAADDRAWRSTLRKGSFIDAKDRHGTWYDSKVVAVAGELLTVHFRSWMSKFDEKIGRNDAQRIALPHSHTTNWRSKLKPGQEVDVAVATADDVKWRIGWVVSCDHARTPVQVAVVYRENPAITNLESADPGKAALRVAVVGPESDFIAPAAQHTHDIPADSRWRQPPAAVFVNPRVWLEAWQQRKAEEATKRAVAAAIANAGGSPGGVSPSSSASSTGGNNTVSNGTAARDLKSDRMGKSKLYGAKSALLPASSSIASSSSSASKGGYNLRRSAIDQIYDDVDGGDDDNSADPEMAIADKFYQDVCSGGGGGYGYSSWRSNREGGGNRPGVCGLDNLGNTCFMNSMLQCLSNAEAFTRYFLDLQYVREINKNNPLGSKGRLAHSYGSLLRAMWEGRFASVVPRLLKNMVAHIAPQFEGYQQHDSQEFMSFLLDGLLEDLCRIPKKPYVEAIEGNGRPDAETAALSWQNYLKRNDSQVADVFAGQFRSHVQCNACGHESTTFDPFITVSVPIPRAPTREQLDFFYFDHHGSAPAKMRFIHLEGEGPTGSDLARHIVNLLTVEARLRGAAKPTKQHQVPVVVPNPADLLITATVNAGGRIYKVFGPGDEVVDGRDTSIMVWHTPGAGSAAPLASPAATASQSPSAAAVDANAVPASKRGRVGSIGGSVPAAAASSSSSSSASSSSMHAADGDVDADDADARSTGQKRVRQATPAGAPSSSSSSATAAADDVADDVASAGYPEPPLYLPVWHRRASDSGMAPASDNLVITLVNEDGSRRTNAQVLDEIHRKLQRHFVRPAAIDPLNPPYTVGVLPIATADAAVVGEKVYPRAKIQSRIPRNDEPFTRPIFVQSSKSAQGAAGDPRSHPIGIMAGPAASSSSSSSSSSSAAGVAPAAAGPAQPLYAQVTLDWNSSKAYDDLFELQSGGAWEAHESFAPNAPSLGYPLGNKPANVIKLQTTLYDCFDKFGTREQLGENDKWYCPKCKAHVRAYKQMRLWKTPDVLIVHLKRFSSHGTWGQRRKIDEKVDFPIEGLDLSQYLAPGALEAAAATAPGQLQPTHDAGAGASSSASSSSAAAPSSPAAVSSVHAPAPIYDCFAVSQHGGGLGGGHYTAVAKNWQDGRWYNFNDSSASPLGGKGRIVDSSAYVLFYRRRGARADAPAGAGHGAAAGSAAGGDSTNYNALPDGNGYVDDADYQMFQDDSDNPSAPLYTHDSAAEELGARPGLGRHQDSDGDVEDDGFHLHGQFGVDN